MSSLCRTALLVAALLIAGTNGFVAPSPSKVATSRIGTELYIVERTGFDSFANARPIKDVSYGEESRQYRRTVYSHDDWVKHRSPDRFIYYLGAMVSSGVYKNLGREVTLTTAVAAFVCLWNVLTGEYQGLDGVKHAGVLAETLIPVLTLPLAPFTLASPSLGLLLVFRTNTSYQRWDEARKNWGMNINHTRDLVRMANAYYDSRGVPPQERQQDLQHVALCTWAFVRAMKRHLSPEKEDEVAFRAELFEKLPQLQAQKIIDAAHRPNRALQDLSYAVENLPMHFMRKNKVQAAATIFEDNLGSSERLLTSPVPVFYSRHTARFLSAYLLLLPFALYEPFAFSWNHIAMVPATAVLSIFLFGIEELATQLEEPFTILPMQVFCDKIYNWCSEIMTWSPGDNGMQVKPVKPEHAYFAGAYMPPTSTPSYVKPVEEPELAYFAGAYMPSTSTPSYVKPVEEPVEELVVEEPVEELVVEPVEEPELAYFASAYRPPTSTPSYVKPVEVPNKVPSFEGLMRIL